MILRLKCRNVNYIKQFYSLTSTNALIRLKNHLLDNFITRLLFWLGTPFATTTISLTTKPQRCLGRDWQLGRGGGERETKASIQSTKNQIMMDFQTILQHQLKKIRVGNHFLCKNRYQTLQFLPHIEICRLKFLIWRRWPTEQRKGRFTWHDCSVRLVVLAYPMLFQRPIPAYDSHAKVAIHPGDSNELNTYISASKRAIIGIFLRIFTPDVPRKSTLRLRFMSRQKYLVIFPSILCLWCLRDKERTLRVVYLCKNT